MKRKLLTSVFALTMAFALTACGSATAAAETSVETAAEAETEVATQPATEEGISEVAGDQKPETITIQSLNGDRTIADLEVPFDPQRIAVIDMPSLDILNTLGLGDRIVGSAKVTIDYLTKYNPEDSNGVIANLGSIKTADLEQVAACEPDIIFIGGRLSASYNDLSAIAPVVYLGVDYEKGVVQSTADNAMTIASIFGKEAEVSNVMEQYQIRIDALSEVIKDKNILLAMYNNNALALMDTESQLNILAAELGGVNLGENVGEETKATHGEDASWETIIELNPEYIFVLDRSTATGAAEEGVLGAKEVIENDLIKQLDCYKEGKIIYFIEHANVWYTSTGGVQALDTMLSDLEGALLNK